MEDNLILVIRPLINQGLLSLYKSSLMTKMLELTRRSRIIVLGTFVAWTLTSFLSHECGKTFLTSVRTVTFTESHVHYFIASLTLTLIQSLTCMMYVHLNISLKLIPITVVMSLHFMSTLATNYSMSYIEPSCTLTIKLTEPVFMVIVHCIVFKTKVSSSTIISIPIIIFGALLFSVQSIRNIAETTGIFLAFVSNIILAARNVAIKTLQGPTTNTSLAQLRSVYHIGYLLSAQITLLAFVNILENAEIIAVKSFYNLGAVMASGIFHVAYSYISTNVVLTEMNVISHSIANIFKRLLVVLLLYTFGQRSASIWNLLGLSLAALGLYIYVMGKTERTSAAVDKVKILVGSAKHLHWGAFIFLCIFVAITTVNITQENQSEPNGRTLLQKFLCGRSYLPRGLGYNIYIAEKDPRLGEFLQWRLVEHPEDTDMKSKTLTTNKHIIEEAQRVLMNLLSDLIGPIKNVMLMEVATYSNKGDAAIAAGQVMLLHKLNKTIVYYCDSSKCNKYEQIEMEKKISQNYSKDDVVILLQGGGNLIGYSGVDFIRKDIMDRFPDHKKILLSQSIWLTNRHNDSLIAAQRIYNNRTNLTIFLRDRQSLEIAKKYFTGIKLILAPDMAFGLGALPRQMPPMHDIMWLRRDDLESSQYVLPTFPSNISIHVSDWRSDWISNVGTRDLETCFLVAFAGVEFLQRGRVVITDRLHGHILSTLLNIPHVLIDNPPYFKLSYFDKSWTNSLENAVLVNNGTLAIVEALNLLSMYDSQIPQVPLI